LFSLGLIVVNNATLADVVKQFYNIRVSLDSLYGIFLEVD